MATVASRVDRWGAWASGLCAVHCIATGLAMGLLSSLGAVGLADPKVEVGFGVLALGLGALAAWTGFRKHRRWMPSAVLLTGLGVLAWRFHIHFEGFQNIPAVLAGAHDHCCPHGPTPMETALSVVGGSCLIGFHMWNSRLGHG